MLRWAIRDVLWLIMVGAVAANWYADRDRLTKQVLDAEANSLKAEAKQRLAEREAYEYSLLVPTRCR